MRPAQIGCRRSRRYQYMLAAGSLSLNLYQALDQGTVGFGKYLPWTARPRAMRVKYHATIHREVDYVKYKNDSGKESIAMGQKDKAHLRSHR